MLTPDSLVGGSLRLTPIKWLPAELGIVDSLLIFHALGDSMVAVTYKLTNNGISLWSLVKQNLILLKMMKSLPSFVVFTDQSVTTKLFQWNSLCNRLWPYKTTLQPQMLSSKLQFSFAYCKTFLYHLKQFAIYGIC